MFHTKLHKKPLEKITAATIRAFVLVTEFILLYLLGTTSFFRQI